MNKSTKALALAFTVLALAACGSKKKDAPSDAKAKPGPAKPAGETTYEFSANSEVVGKDDSINLSVNVPKADKSGVDTFTLTVPYGPVGPKYIAMNSENKDLAVGINSIGTTDQAYAVFVTSSKISGGVVYLLTKDDKGLLTLSDSLNVNEILTASEVLSKIQAAAQGKSIKDVIVSKSWQISPMDNTNDIKGPR